jgi:2-acylglycerol O-acyltransferase 2
VGGSQEAFLARPGSYRLVLKNRKGFIRIALQTGSSLVPVFAFGENEVFDRPIIKHGSLLYLIVDSFMKKTGISLPLVLGRGFFQYSFGLIPKRAAITTVVGGVITVAKNIHPSDEDVNNLHKLFIESLQKLFENNKVKYSHSTAQLIIE